VDTGGLTVTADPDALVAAAAARRRSVLAVVPYTDVGLGAAALAGRTARLLGVPLTVALLRPHLSWILTFTVLPLPEFYADHERDAMLALVRALDPSGMCWRLRVVDTVPALCDLVRRLDPGLVVVGTRRRFAARLAKRVSVPVCVWAGHN